MLSFMDCPYAVQPQEQAMDIYLSAGKGDVDVILMIHGGGWMEGDKAGHKGMCADYAEKGYAAATMNYRLLKSRLPLEQQATDCEGMLDDIGSAIAALKGKLIAEGYSPKKMAIFGGSAGGHLAMLYGYRCYTQSVIPIAFLAPDVGPSNFLDAAFLELHGEAGYLIASALTGQIISYQDFLDQAPALRKISPEYFVAPDVPPTLMRYGKQDSVVPLSQGISIKAALDAAGVRNDLFIYPNSGHGLNHPADKPLTDTYFAKLQEYFDAYF